MSIRQFHIHIVVMLEWVPYASPIGVAHHGIGSEAAKVFQRKMRDHVEVSEPESGIESGQSVHDVNPAWQVEMLEQALLLLTYEQLVSMLNALEARPRSLGL